MSERWRLTFEMVSPSCLHLYCNADPLYYAHTTQTVPNSEIPDEHWHQVERITDDRPDDQWTMLRQWAGEDREFVRRVKLERSVTEPDWQEVIT